jgi:hypothetical protein
MDQRVQSLKFMMIMIYLPTHLFIPRLIVELLMMYAKLPMENTALDFFDVCTVHCWVMHRKPTLCRNM